MSTRKFGSQVSVARLWKDDPTFDEGLVRDVLDKRLSGELRGPRGGRYLPIGEITIGRTEHGRDFEMGSVTYWATRQARYVRPSS